jgi:hypothetical protein
VRSYSPAYAALTPSVVDVAVPAGSCAFFSPSQFAHAERLADAGAVEVSLVQVQVGVDSSGSGSPTSAASTTTRSSVVPAWAQLQVSGAAVQLPYQHDAAAAAEAGTGVGIDVRSSALGEEGLRVRLCASPAWGGQARAVNLSYGGRVQTLVVTPLLAPDSCPQGSYRLSSPTAVTAVTTPTLANTTVAGNESEVVGGEWCALCPAGTAFANAAATSAAETGLTGFANGVYVGGGSNNTYSASVEAIVGIMACVPCPEGFVSGEGAVQCVSCGSVYNSNDAGTACTVRWYVYAGGAVTVALVAITLATAQTLFRFGNRQVEKLMWQAREARRLQLAREKRRRERAVAKKARRLGGGIGGGSRDYGDGGHRHDSDSEEDEDVLAVKQEVSSTLDMVLAEAAIATTAIAAVDAMAASAAAAASLLTGANRKELSDAIKIVVVAQKIAVEAAAVEATSVGRSWPVVQATKHALGEISVAMMREADAELIDTLAAAAADAPKNSFQATLLANRLANAKFVRSRQAAAEWDKNAHPLKGTGIPHMLKLLGTGGSGGLKDIGARSAPAEGEAKLHHRAADPSARFALVVLPDELNECANRHSREAESEVTLTALGLRDDVEDAAVVVEAEQVADAHLGAARLQLARMVIKAKAAVAAALRANGGGTGDSGTIGTFLNFGGGGADAEAAARAHAAVAELGTNANALLTRLQRIAAQRHAALMNKLNARGQTTRSDPDGFDAAADALEQELLAAAAEVATAVLKISDPYALRRKASTAGATISSGAFTSSSPLDAVLEHASTAVLKLGEGIAAAAGPRLKGSSSGTVKAQAAIAARREAKQVARTEKMLEDAQRQLSDAQQRLAQELKGAARSSRAALERRLGPRFTREGSFATAAAAGAAAAAVAAADAADAAEARGGDAGDRDAPPPVDESAAVDALCSAAELEAIEAVAEAVAATAGIPFDTEAARQAYLAQCAAVQDRIDAAAAARAAALEARRAKRRGGAGAPAPEPGTPEAQAEAEQAEADAAAFVAELEAAVQTITVDTAGALKELEDAKARLLAGLDAAGGKCKSGLEARLAARRKAAPSSPSPPVSPVTGYTKKRFSLAAAGNAILAASDMSAALNALLPNASGDWSTDAASASSVAMAAAAAAAGGALGARVEAVAAPLDPQLDTDRVLSEFEARHGDLQRQLRDSAGLYSC